MSENPSQLSSLTGSFLRQVEQVESDFGTLSQYVEGSHDLIAEQDPDYADTMINLSAAVLGDLTGLRRESVQVVERMNALDNLSATTALVNSSLDPTEVLNAVVDAIVQITGAERAYIVLSENGALTPYAARNWDSETVPTNEMTFSNTIIQTTLQDGKSIVTTNAQQDARFMGAESITFKAVRAVMCVPLISRGQIIGVVYADNRMAVGVFNPDTIQLVATFANQAAIAIENARRFSTVKQRLEETQSQLTTLQIHVDDAMRDAALKELTETEYFARLQSLVRSQRDRSKRS